MEWNSKAIKAKAEIEAANYCCKAAAYGHNRKKNTERGNERFEEEKTHTGTHSGDHLRIGNEEK